MLCTEYKRKEGWRTAVSTGKLKQCSPGLVCNISNFCEEDENVGLQRQKGTFAENVYLHFAFFMSFF
jgi:hypothetical protein